MKVSCRLALCHMILCLAQLEAAILRVFNKRSCHMIFCSITQVPQHRAIGNQGISSQNTGEGKNRGKLVLEPSCNYSCRTPRYFFLVPHLASGASNKPSKTHNRAWRASRPSTRTPSKILPLLSCSSSWCALHANQKRNFRSMLY